MPPRAESDSAVTGSRFTTDPPLPLARTSVENVNTLVAGTAAAQLSQNVPDVVDGVSEAGSSKIQKGQSKTFSEKNEVSAMPRSPADAQRRNSSGTILLPFCTRCDGHLL
eukprot:scpid3109/ scgid6022/ 